MLRLLEEEELTPSETEEIDDASVQYNDDEIDEIINDLAEDVLSESQELVLESEVMNYVEDTLLEDGELDLEQEDLNEDFIYKLPNGRKYYRMHDFQGTQVLFPFFGKTPEEKEENAYNKEIESIMSDFIQIIRKASLKIEANCNGQHSKLMIHFSDFFAVSAFIYGPICDAFPSLDNSDSYYLSPQFRGFPLKLADENKNEININNASEAKLEALKKSPIIQNDGLYKEYLKACQKVKHFYEKNRHNRDLIKTLRVLFEDGYFPVKELCNRIGIAYLSDGLRVNPLFRPIDDRFGLKNQSMMLYNLQLDLISQLERYKQNWRLEGRQTLIEGEELYDSEEIGNGIYDEI